MTINCLRIIENTFSVAVYWRKYTVAVRDGFVYLDMAKMGKEQLRLLMQSGYPTQTGQIDLEKLKEATPPAIDKFAFVPMEVEKARLDKCGPCKYNTSWNCKEQERIQKRPASIMLGVKLPQSYCPINEWDVYGVSNGRHLFVLNKRLNKEDQELWEKLQ